MVLVCLMFLLCWLPVDMSRRPVLLLRRLLHQVLCGPRLHHCCLLLRARVVARVVALVHDPTAPTVT